MEAPNLVKVVAAFVAGVVIALGSALTYVRVSEMGPSQPLVVAQAPTDAPQPAATQPPETAQEPPTKAASAPVATAPATLPVRRAKKLSSRWVTRRQVVIVPARKPQPKIALAQLAQNRVPVTEPVTYAAMKVDAAPPESAPSTDPPPATDPALQAPDPAALPQTPPVLQPHVVTLEAGTALPIRLSETLSTDHNYTGDTFRGTLEAPIIMDGFIIADRGSKVLGRVVASDRSGRMQGAADLNVTLTEINTTDGQRIHLETNSFEQRGPTSMGQDAATIAGGAALGAIIGAAAGGGKGAAIGAGIGGAAGTGAVLASRAKPATLPVETKMTFRLATPVTITERLN